MVGDDDDDDAPWVVASGSCLVAVYSCNSGEIIV